MTGRTERLVKQLVNLTVTHDWSPMFKQAVLVAGFLAAIVAANLTLTWWGPVMILPNAFALIGLDLVTRDRLADYWGTTRFVKQAALILAGGLISYLVNSDAATIAKASVIAFCAAEGVEAVAYHVLRRQPWKDRAPRSAVFGAAVDSVLFITIAFGWSFTLSFGQFCAKVAGAVIWTWIIGSFAPAPAKAPADEHEAAVNATIDSLVAL